VSTPLASTSTSKPLSFGLSVGWGMGTLAMSLMFQSTSVFILKYLVDFVGIAAATAGMIISLAKIYDAIVDPLIGTISDRTRTRWGRRRPYLFVGTFIAAISFVLLFHLAALDATSGLLFIVLFALLLNATGYSLFNIPYLAMPAEMTNDFHARTKLIAFRTSAVAVGGLLASSAGPAIIERFGNGVAGYSAMSLVMGSIILIAGLACFWITRAAPTTVFVSQAGGTIGEQFRTALQNRPFMLLLGVKLSHLIGLSMFMASLPFLFRNVLDLSYGALGLYFLVQNICTLITQPIWLKLTRAIGKNRAYYIAVVFYMVGLASWLLASKGEPDMLIALRAVLTGVAAGGVLLLGQSMLPDTMQYDFQRTGLRREGIFAGVYTTVEGLSFALGPAIVGVVLGAAGYISGAGDVQQPASAQTAIFICASLLPAIGICGAGLIMTRYRLSAEDLRAARGNS
jgi:GPH family glycoside/pentoside/hexuronide:cation symporter